MKFLEKFTKYEYPLFGFVRLPTISLSREELEKVGEREGCSNYDYLRKLAWVGFKELVPKGQEEIYKNRVIEELQLVKKLGFVEYLLLVHKLYAFCEREKIATGFGRGSAPSLLLFFLLKVTKKVDPIKYKFVLQRFISEARAGIKVIDGITYLDGNLLCDFDADVSGKDRPRCVEFLKSLYPNRICKIANVTLLTGKALIKHVFKAVGEANEEEAKAVSDMVEKRFGVVAELSDNYEKVPKFKEWCDNHKKEYRIAQRIANCVSAKSQHASGYIVSHDELDSYIPLELSANENSSDKDVCACFVGTDIAALTVKLDILGVRCCSVVADVFSKIPEKIEDINVDNDPIIYNALQDMKAKQGIFQLEQDATYRCQKAVKSKDLMQLSCVNALSRPGAFAFVEKFANYTNNGVFESIHPFFDDILKETGGIPLFQEQLLFMANKIGFSLTESEILRKIVGKKQKEKMVEWEQKIKNKVKENNLPVEVGDILWSVANASADYSFNKCIFEEEMVNHKTKGNIQLKQVEKGDEIEAFDVKNNKNHWVKVKTIYYNIKDCYSSNFEGYNIITSSDHKFLCADRKMWALKHLWRDPKTFKVFTNNKKQYLKEHINSEHVGLLNTIDLEVDHSDHNFYCNDIVVSNSHSTSYAALAAICVWLRESYPTIFFNSLLCHAKHEPAPLDEIANIQAELRYYGIKLLPPHLLKSDVDFKIEGNDIRFGLGSIKGISDKVIEKLMAFRQPYMNRIEMFAAAKEAGIGINVVCSMIHCGCLSDVVEKTTRGRIALEANLFNALTDKEKKLVFQYAEQFNYDVILIVDFLRKNTDSKGKLFIKESRFATIKTKFTPWHSVYAQNLKHQRLTNLFYEISLLGYSFSSSLYEAFKNSGGVRNLISVGEVIEQEEDALCEFFARVIEAKSSTSKKGNKYFKMSCRDSDSTINCMIFSSAYQDKLSEIKVFNQNKMPEEGSIVHCIGRKKGDSVFIDKLALQDTLIYTKWADLKKHIKEEEKNQESKF